jgi:4-amino-4-deoxy-L-arabinose transferase-like glycosyltransferase
VLGGAALLRLVVALVALGAMPLVSDARDYFEAATGFEAAESHSAFYWPPGQPAVLAGAFALIGRTVTAARMVTVALSVASVALTALLGRELGGKRAGRAAGLLAAAYVPAVLLCAQPYAQHLAALCLAAVAYFGLRAAREHRWWLFAGAGAALGLGCLARPSMVSVVPVIAVFWALALHRDPGSRRALVPGAAFATTVALLLTVPAAAHNARAGAGWTISTNNERNLFLGNNPYTPDYKTSHLGQRSLDELAPEVRSYLESYYARPDAREAMRDAALHYMASHPLRTAWRTLNRASSFWGFDYLASREIQKWRGETTARALPLLALEAASYLAVAVLALAGLVARSGGGDGTWRAWLIGLTVAYEAPYAIAFSGGTYHFPVMGLVIPFAGLAIARGAAWREGREKRAAVTAWVVFGAVQVQYAYFAIALGGGTG